MKIETKYDIGQKVYWIDQYWNEYRVNYSEIKSINLGGKIWEKYEIGNTTRAERDLYLDFGDAKEVAIKKQKEKNKELLLSVKRMKDPNTNNRFN